MKKIFILSKETTITQKLATFLKSQSFATQAAHDVDQAAKVIAEKPFDLIIIDMSFRKECIERFYQLSFAAKIKIPTLYLCDIPTKGNYLNGLTLLTQYFLFKPFKTKELVNILRAMLIRG